jgi:O-methyltransferase
LSGWKRRLKLLPVLGPLAVQASHRLRRHVSEETLTRLSYGVDYVFQSDVEGDVAEFGTCWGETAVAIARALARWEGHPEVRPKVFHLFDSFQGLPEIESEIDKKSLHVRSGDWRGGICRGLDRAELENLLRFQLPGERLRFHEGWYKDTVPRLSGAKFSMIHVDSDLYSSSLDALTPLFSTGAISEGAVFFFDSWNCNRASPETGQRKAWADLTARFSISSSDGGDYSWEGHKHIVHSYRAP